MVHKLQQEQLTIFLLTFLCSFRDLKKNIFYILSESLIDWNPVLGLKYQFRKKTGQQALNKTLKLLLMFNFYSVCRYLFTANLGVKRELTVGYVSFTFMFLKNLSIK